MTVAAVYASWSASQGHISPKTAATRRSAWNSRVSQQWGDVAVVDVKTAAIKAWVSKMTAQKSACRPSRMRSACYARCSAPQSKTAAYRAIRARVCGYPT